MSTFLNISGGTLLVQGYLRTEREVLGVGASRYISPGSTFTGSNYYKRFTYTGLIASGIDIATASQNAILKCTIDDGLAFSDDLPDVPNNPLVYHKVVAGGTVVALDFLTDLQGPSEFTSISTDQNIAILLNGNAGASVNIEANTTVTFNVGDLLLNSLTISNTASGAHTANVQVLAAGRV